MSSGELVSRDCSLGRLLQKAEAGAEADNDSMSLSRARLDPPVDEQEQGQD